MLKRIMGFLLAVCLLSAALISFCTAESSSVQWTEEERARLRVGNPTGMRGQFFTNLWDGGNTSDLDVQSLLHAYAPVRYDPELTRYRFDRSIVEDAIALDDQEGNRTYLMVLADDLYWSDGAPITSADYAFSVLFAMDPVIRETGGEPADYSWMVGAEEYLNHTSDVLSGMRMITEQILQIEVKAEALPYFYELSRLMIYPYPASVIAPGITVKDDGMGVYFSEPLNAEMIRQTVLDPETGYMTHPSVVSGPYTLESFDGETARLRINPYYKGNEEGIRPRIGEVEYTVADNRDMIEQLGNGTFGLLNKVTLAQSITAGLQGQDTMPVSFSAENYARTGLTMLWFMENSPKMQEMAVRKAIACCFDRKSFSEEYVGPYGMQVDGFYGLGQWMYRLASGLMKVPVDESLPEEEYHAAAEAFEGISLDGLTIYSLETEKAAEILEAAGWTLNEAGIRSKTVNGAETELRLTLGLPESEEAGEWLEKYLVRYLAELGIPVTMQPMTMEEVEKAYLCETDTVDLLYLGEDFPIRFDPKLLEPFETVDPENQAADSLTAVKAELYGMAKEMVRTEPDDLAGFLTKWVALQEKITETLPLVPVYSNAYFDFFTRELHNYRITRAVTWGEAIVESYISDVEEEKWDR